MGLPQPNHWSLKEGSVQTVGPLSPIKSTHRRTKWHYDLSRHQYIGHHAQGEKRSWWQIWHLQLPTAGPSKFHVTLILLRRWAFIMGRPACILALCLTVWMRECEGSRCVFALCGVCAWAGCSCNGCAIPDSGVYC